MSLVNDMLQDLERRRGDDTEPLAGLQAVPRTDTPPRSRRAAMVAGLGLAGIAAALAVVAWPGRQGGSEIAPPTIPVAAEVRAADSRRSMRLVETPTLTDETASRGLTLYRMSYALGRSPAPRTAVAAAPPPDARRAGADAGHMTARPPEPTVPRPVNEEPALEPQPQDPPAPARLSKVAADPMRNWRRDGLRSLRADRPGEAADNFRRMVAHDPAQTEAHLLLHRALRAQRRPDNAQLTLFAALETAAEPARIAVVLGHELLAADDAGTAARVLEQYRPARFGDLAYEGLLAAAYERSGAHELALAQYDALTALDPRNGAWWVGAGIANEALGRPGAALAAFRRASATALEPALAQYARERIATLEGES